MSAEFAQSGSVYLPILGVCLLVCHALYVSLASRNSSSTRKYERVASIHWISDKGSSRKVAFKVQNNYAFNHRYPDQVAPLIRAAGRGLTHRWIITRLHLVTSVLSAQVGHRRRATVAAQRPPKRTRSLFSHFSFSCKSRIFRSRPDETRTRGLRHAKAAKPFLMLSSVFEIPLI